MNRKTSVIIGTKPRVFKAGEKVVMPRDVPMVVVAHKDATVTVRDPKWHDKLRCWLRRVFLRK